MPRSASRPGRPASAIIPSVSDHSTDDWLVAVTVRRHAEADRHYWRKSGTVSVSSTGQRRSTYTWLDGGSILVTASAPARRLGVSHMTLLDKGVGPGSTCPTSSSFM